MLDCKQEYEQWLKNYDILLSELKAAWRFKNKRKIDEINKRILNTQVQIAMCAKRLKEKTNPDANRRIGSSVSTNVNCRKNSTMYLNSVLRSWFK